MTQIRAALTRDLPGAYHVCALTAGAGDGLPEGSVHWADSHILGHVYVGPYFPGGSDAVLATVAVDHLGVAGYCLAATDTAAWAVWCAEHWWPGLRADYPLDADYPQAEREIVELIHQPPVSAPDLLANYPAHLHIDLLDRVRGTGLGRQLLAGMLDALRDREVRGVHLGVGAGNVNAIGFYRHLGFQMVDRGEGVTMAMTLAEPGGRPG